MMLPIAAVPAGFDCGNARRPIEQAICQNSALSDADQAMAASYRFLLSHCREQAGIGGLPASQKAWLAESGKNFGGGPDAVKRLAERYAERNAYLAERVSRCVQTKHLPAPVIVKTLREDKLDLSLPYVETVPPDSGRRINDWIFGRLLEMPAPASLAEGRAALATAFTDAGVRPLIFAGYFVVRNDGRVLMLEVAIEGCGAYCSTSTEQYFFDVRSGRWVQPEDLFTIEGGEALARRLKSNRIRRAKAILALGIKQGTMSEDERETYQRCIDDWKEWEPRLWGPGITPDGRWRFDPGRCSAHVNRTQDALDDLAETLSLSELKPHLNPYGRSLLLGEGDVRDPVPDAIRCKDGIRLPPPGTSGPLGKVAGLAAGEDHFLLLMNDGRLWAWGDNDDGQLGDGSETESSVPVPVGNDFIQAGAGLRFSAGLRRDGSLWTWGMNYQGRLGDGGTASQTRPVRIGENFTALALNTHTGMALHRDGTLWTWGHEVVGQDEHRNLVYCLTPSPLAPGVAQMEFGPRDQILALKKDGSLWAWGHYGGPESYRKSAEPLRIGDGYTRLAARAGNLAFKADGSLWAWGETLQAVGTEGRVEQNATEVGRDFVKASVADYRFVAALKADGSLWATHARGQTVRLEPVGCGYVDVVAAGGSESATVLALKRDGSLLAWHDWSAEARQSPYRLMFAVKPVAVGKGFSKLFQVGGLWGSRTPQAAAVKADGGLWLWQEPDQDEPKPPQGRLRKVPLPDD